MQVDQGQGKPLVPADDMNSTPEQRDGQGFRITHTYLPEHWDKLLQPQCPPPTMLQTAERKTSEQRLPPTLRSQRHHDGGPGLFLPHSQSPRTHFRAGSGGKKTRPSVTAPQVHSQAPHAGEPLSGALSTAAGTQSRGAFAPRGAHEYTMLLAPGLLVTELK